MGKSRKKRLMRTQFGMIVFFITLFFATTDYANQYTQNVPQNQTISHKVANIFTSYVLAENENMENPELQLDSKNGLGYFISKVNTYTSEELPRKKKGIAVPFTMFSTKDVGGSPVLYMNKKGYDNQTTKMKQDILDKVFKTLNASDMNNRDKNRIVNWLEGVDQMNSTVVQEFSANTRTDLYGAQQFLMPFQGTVGTIFGVLAITIGLTLTFSFVWDVAFLSVPIFTAMLTRNGDVSGNNRPFLVSQDAILAYQQGTSESKQVLTIWLKLRSKSALIIGLCLTYLVSNQIWQVMTFLIDVVGRWLGWS